jgi:hypothetical protein
LGSSGFFFLGGGLKSILVGLRLFGVLGVL